MGNAGLMCIIRYILLSLGQYRSELLGHNILAIVLKKDRTTVGIKTGARRCDERLYSLNKLGSISTDGSHTVMLKVITFKGFWGADNIFTVHQALASLHLHSTSLENRKHHDIGLFKVRT